MIIIRIIGGLGNQMFQFAAAKALALEKAHDLILDKSLFANYTLHNYSLDHFHLDQKFYKRQNKYLTKLKNLFKTIHHYQEKEFNFNSDIQNINSDVIFLNGYFQSEKYFIKYEKEIRADFKIQTELSSKALEMLSRINATNSVSIHIRRGDYLQHPIHNTDKTDFYKNAMKTIEGKIENPSYFIFSDDIEWSKNNFKTNFEIHFIDFTDASTNYEDLKLMSECKHNIIANSSFSWWGAWLNENPQKIVIAPKTWFNDEKHNTADVIPDNWIKL